MRLCASAKIWFGLLLLSAVYLFRAQEVYQQHSFPFADYSDILPRSIESIQDPRLYPLQCGNTNNKESLLCDPDRFLSTIELESINKLLQPRHHGVEIVFVIVGSMNMSSVENHIELTMADAAELFAGELFNRFLNSDNEFSNIHKALVFLSIQDRVIYFVTGESLQFSVSSDYIQEIVDSMRPFLQQNRYFEAIETCIVSLLTAISRGMEIVAPINNDDGVIIENANSTVKELETNKNETISIIFDSKNDNNPPKQFIENDGDDHDGDNDDDDGDETNGIFEYLRQQKASESLLSNNMILGGFYGAVGFLTVRKVLSYFRSSSSLQRPQQTIGGIKVSASVPIALSKKVSIAPQNISTVAAGTLSSFHPKPHNNRNSNKNAKTILLLHRLDSDSTDVSHFQDSTNSGTSWDLLEQEDSNLCGFDDSHISPLNINANEDLFNRHHLKTQNRWIYRQNQASAPSRQKQHSRGKWTLARRMLHYVATPIIYEDNSRCKDQFHSPSKRSDCELNRHTKTYTKNNSCRTDGGQW